MLVAGRGGATGSAARGAPSIWKTSSSAQARITGTARGIGASSGFGYWVSVAAGASGIGASVLTDPENRKLPVRVSTTRTPGGLWAAPGAAIDVASHPTRAKR